MWERTITIGSGGKTFSATGWKVPVFLAVYFKVSHFDVQCYIAELLSVQVGWAISSAHIIKHMKTIHQNTVYHCATPAQVLLLMFQTQSGFVMFRHTLHTKV